MTYELPSDSVSLTSILKLPMEKYGNSLNWNGEFPSPSAEGEESHWNHWFVGT